jgi:hypothetical protein
LRQKLSLGIGAVRTPSFPLGLEIAFPHVRVHYRLETIRLDEIWSGVMKILVSGATGLVGSALSEELKAQNHTVVRLTRGTAGPGEVFWDPMAGKLDVAALDGVEAVVHLAGENIAGRWTDAKKKAIRDSRINGTKTLCDAVLKSKVAPTVFISAAAIGFYGNRGDEVLTESSAPGAGFLPDVCKDWEAASEPLERVGIRTVRLRFGVILSAKGGALAKMLMPFKMGVGGVIGSGTIHELDFARRRHRRNPLRSQKHDARRSDQHRRAQRDHEPRFHEDARQRFVTPDPPADAGVRGSPRVGRNGERLVARQHPRETRAPDGGRVRLQASGIRRSVESSDRLAVIIFRNQRYFARGKVASKPHYILGLNTARTVKVNFQKIAPRADRINSRIVRGTEYRFDFRTLHTDQAIVTKDIVIHEPQKILLPDFKINAFIPRPKRAKAAAQFGQHARIFYLSGNDFIAAMAAPVWRHQRGMITPCVRRVSIDLPIQNERRRHQKNECCNEQYGPRTQHDTPLRFDWGRRCSYDLV